MRGKILTAAAACGLLVATPAQAGSGSASLAGVQVSYSIASQASFDGPRCAPVDWSVRYSRPYEYDLYVTVELRQRGSNSSYEETVSPLYSDPDSGTLAGDSLCIGYSSWEPSAGDFVVSGTLEVEDDNYVTLGKVPLSGTFRVAVVQNPSKFTRLKVKAGTTYAKPPMVKGKVTAKTLTKGRLGADGDVVIEAKIKGKWRKVDTVYPNSFGRFSTTLYKQVPKGLKVRARLVDCGWCTDAKKAARAR
ncbi:MAG: hypothetical protein R2720_03380 [Candidatus Nanopelagicales bacterium]